jgi:hypothetical protein
MPADAYGSSPARANAKRKAVTTWIALEAWIGRYARNDCVPLGRDEYTTAVTEIEDDVQVCKFRAGAEERRSTVSSSSR